MFAHFLRKHYKPTYSQLKKYANKISERVIMKITKDKIAMAYMSNPKGKKHAALEQS